MFDIELFSAQLEDWKLRVYEIGYYNIFYLFFIDYLLFFTIYSCLEVKSSSQEFEKKYKELIKVRTNYKKAVESYEKKLQQQNEIIVLHEKLRTELYHMKNKLQEVFFYFILFLFYFLIYIF